MDFADGRQVVAASEYTVVKYIYYKQILTDVGFILLGITLIALITTKQGFENLFLMFFLFSLFSLIFAFYFLVKCANLASSIKKTFIMDILWDLGYCFVFLAYFLVFKKVLDISMLPFFIIPHIILVTIRMCFSFDRQTFADNQVWAFFEAFQILWISLKLVNSSGHPDWVYVLLLLYIVCGFMLFIGVISAVAYPCLMIAYCNIPNEQAEQKNLLLFLSRTLFFLSWKTIAYFILLRNFHAMANENKVTPGTPITPKDSSLMNISIVLIIFAFLDIFYLCAVSDTMKRIFSTRLFISNKNEEIAVQNLSAPMNMQLMQVGANYFQRRNANEEQNLTESQAKKAPEIMDCMICCDKPSATLIRPCNHGGICEDCMVRYLEGKNICPHCKVSIKKVYIIDYDEEKRSYMAKRIITCQ